MIYLAAPFFTTPQLQTVESVETLLKEVSAEFYSPRSDGILKDMTPEERTEAAPRIFKINVAKIEASKAIVALLDHKDSGTTWELGFAYAKGKPIIGLCRRPLNLMLQNCITFHAWNFGDLRRAVKQFVKTGKVHERPAPLMWEN